MQDEDKTKEQLITELRVLRQRLAESEKDKTECRWAEQALEQSNARISHLNDVLRAIRDVGTIINREKDPIVLSKAVCDSLVQTRGYVIVWIGELEADSKRVLPVATRERAGISCSTPRSPGMTAPPDRGLRAQRCVNSGLWFSMTSPPTRASPSGEIPS